MKVIKIWGHDAFFDYCDRWMRQDDPYAEARGKHKRPKQEGRTLDPFVDAMWRAYRDTAPLQEMSGKNMKFVWEGRKWMWVPDPRPDAASSGRPEVPTDRGIGAEVQSKRAAGAAARKAQAKKRAPAAPGRILRAPNRINHGARLLKPPIHQERPGPPGADGRRYGRRSRRSEEQGTGS